MGKIYKNSIIYSILSYIFLLIFLFPIFWIFLLSITQREFSGTIQIFGIPDNQYTPTLGNWVTELQTPELYSSIMNSMIIAPTSTIIALILGLPAAYSLARFKFSFNSNKYILIFFLALRMIPILSVLVAYYVIFNIIYLFDTKIAIIIVQTSFILPFVIIIVRQAFVEVPLELEEAALLDGASHLGSFLFIAIPLTIPAIVASSLIMFAFAWNEYLIVFSLSLFNETLPMYVRSGGLSSGFHFGGLAVRTMLTMLLPMILAILAQKYIVQGLTLGAVKE